MEPGNPAIGFLNESKGVDYAKRFVRLRGEGIPYGTYSVQIGSGEFRIFKRIEVDRPNAVFVLNGRALIAEPVGTTYLNLRVLGCPCEKPEPTWLRLIPAFESTMPGRACVLDLGGVCGLENISSGRYIVVVGQGGLIVWTGVVDFDQPDGSADINISK